MRFAWGKPTSRTGSSPSKRSWEPSLHPGWVGGKGSGLDRQHLTLGENTRTKVLVSGEDEA